MLARLLAALAILSFVLAPRNAYAASWQTVDCSRQGYTLRVPPDWWGDLTCFPIPARMVVSDPKVAMQIIASVEQHSYWDAKRAHSSIINDMACPNLDGVSCTDITYFDSVPFGNKTFSAGIRWEHISSGCCGYTVSKDLFVSEIETFTAGYMYKFRSTMLFDKAPTGPTTRATVLFTILNSIRITKPQE